MKPDQQRVKNLLADTVTLLCKNGLTYKEELRIEGLLGITIDNSEVFLVPITECFTGISNQKSITATPSSSIDIPALLKSPPVKNSTSALNKPTRLICPKNTSNYSSLSVNKNRTTSANSEEKSPVKQVNTEDSVTLDTGQLVIKEERTVLDDDDDVVIVSELDNGKPKDSDNSDVDKTAEHNVTNQDKTFGEVDFSSLQDDSSFTDNLVGSVSLSDAEQPNAKRQRLDNTSFSQSIKQEQDSSLSMSGENQWNTMNTDPTCSWTAEDGHNLTEASGDTAFWNRQHQVTPSTSIHSSASTSSMQQLIQSLSPAQPQTVPPPATIQQHPVSNTLSSPRNMSAAMQQQQPIKYESNTYDTASVQSYNPMAGQRSSTSYSNVKQESLYSPIKQEGQYGSVKSEAGMYGNTGLMPQYNYVQTNTKREPSYNPALYGNSHNWKGGAANPAARFSAIGGRQSHTASAGYQRPANNSGRSSESHQDPGGVGTNGEEFKCPVKNCDKSYAYNSTLLRHIRGKHSIDEIRKTGYKMTI